MQVTKQARTMYTTNQDITIRSKIKKFDDTMRRTRHDKITNDIFPYRTHTMQMQMLMQRNPTSFVILKRKERGRRSKGEKEKEEEEGKREIGKKKKSSVNDMKKETKRTPPIVNTPKHEDAQTTRYPRIRSIS
jgi:hypothetical protein